MPFMEAVFVYACGKRAMQVTAQAVTSVDAIDSRSLEQTLCDISAAVGHLG